MELFFQDYYDHLQKLHAEIGLVLDGLPQEALDWMPGENMNSICVLAVHVAGAERFWIGDVITGETSNRNREAEFLTRGLDAAALREALNASLVHSRAVLERLMINDLHEMRTSPRDGRQFRVGWVLNHALEHIAIHLGHMQITRQVWESEPR